MLHNYCNHAEVICANTSPCYSQIGVFDILVVIIIINWIMKTMMGTVVYETEATHISNMIHLFCCVYHIVD